MTLAGKCSERGFLSLKILHTSDLHLTEKASERWDALDEIVKITSNHQASALVIVGDLFDHNVEADKLRARLRAIFGGSDFQTIILPGNHDHKAYRSGLYFGEKVSVITAWEEPVRVGEAFFWGLPYEKLSGEKLVNRLRKIAGLMNPDNINFLLFHGELLDAYFSRTDLGDEGDLRYMPVKLSYFEPLPIQYVLAGHFHSRYTSWQLPRGGLFIYPGSPVAVTRREIGRRVANLVEQGRDPLEIPLSTHHYEKVVISLDPFNSEDPLIMLDKKMRKIPAESKVILKVEGLFNGSALGMDENELSTKIRARIGSRFGGDPAMEFFDVRHIIEDELFQQFHERLNLVDCPGEQKEQVKQMVVSAFRVVKACS